MSTLSQAEKLRDGKAFLVLTIRMDTYELFGLYVLKEHMKEHTGYHLPKSNSYQVAETGFGSRLLS